MGAPHSIFFGFLLVLAMVSAGAGGASAGDAERGRAKATICTPCHGPNGVSQYPEIPNLAGQNQAYLTAALNALRRAGLGRDMPKGLSKRYDAVMDHQAAGLTDAEIHDLTAHFAALPCTSRETARKSPLPAVGRRCVACHGERGDSATATVPKLAGQHERYLENQLFALRDAGDGSPDARRRRSHPIMSRQVGRLSDDDIRGLARYFADQRCE